MYENIAVKLNLIYAMTLFLLFMSTKCFAFVVTITEKQLNSMLIVGFPYKQNYQGIDVTFSSPYIKLDSVGKKVFITTTILAMQAGKSLHAQGTVEGVVDYKPSTQELQFEKPKLVNFNVIDNQLENSQEALEVVKQNVGKNLPIILLIDFKQFDLGFGKIIPRDIEITSGGLAITL